MKSASMYYVLEIWVVKGQPTYIVYLKPDIYLLFCPQLYFEIVRYLVISACLCMHVSIHWDLNLQEWIPQEK